MLGGPPYGAAFRLDPKYHQSLPSRAALGFSERLPTGSAPQRSFDAPQNRPFPQLNLHKARVRRNHGRPLVRLADNLQTALPDARGAARPRLLLRENAHPVKHQRYQAQSNQLSFLPQYVQKVI
jgi:hypothetical protein